MRHRLYVHLTWTTRDRAPLISPGAAQFLARFLPAVASQERSLLLALAMVTTHVHLLLRLHPATKIPRLVQRLKGGSSVLAEREGHNGPELVLRWAKGYNIESVSPRSVPAVMEYVLNQEERHPDQRIPEWPSVAPAAPAAEAASRPLSVN